MSERPTHGDRERKAPHSPASGSPTGRAVAPVVASTGPTAEAVDTQEPVAPGALSLGQVIHWGRRRLRQALPKVVSRCMSFSASPEFDEALTSAVSRFYGVDVDVATAETDILEDDYERVRFFPWFLWDYPLPPLRGSLVHDEPSFITVGSRFLEHAELTSFEREVLCALTKSSLGFIEVLTVDAQNGALVVLDLASQTRLEVYDPSLAGELEVGLVALVRLIRFGQTHSDGGPADPSVHGVDAAIDAIYAVLPHETRPLVEIELERLLSGEREPLTVLKTHAPELLDFAEHVLSTLTEPPAPLNADREPIVLCHTLVPRGREGRVVTQLEAPGSPFTRTGESAWLWREDDRVVAIIAEREGRRDDALPREPRYLAMASSRERFARLCAWLDEVGEPLPAMHAEATLDAAGEEWLASGARPAWLLDPDVASSTRLALSRWLLRWPDQPHPAAGGRTPRHLAREPGGHELVARLIDRARSIAGDEAKTLEDWLLRTPTGT